MKTNFLIHCNTLTILFFVVFYEMVAPSMFQERQINGKIDQGRPT